MSSRSFYYKNEFYTSIKEFCEKKHITNSDFYDTDKYLPFVDFQNYIVDGKEYRTLKDISRALKIPYQRIRYEHYANRHDSIQDAIDYLRNSHCRRGIPAKDFLGNTYNSLSEMCNTWHVNISTFSRLFADGWTIEQCLLGKNRSKRLRQLELNKDKFTEKQYNYYISQTR